MNTSSSTWYMTTAAVLGVTLGVVAVRDRAPVSVMLTILEAEDDVSDHATAVVRVRNPTDADVTVWRATTSCGCTSMTRGLPLTIPPGGSGEFVLETLLTHNVTACDLQLLTDAPEVRECVWEIRDVARIKPARPKPEELEPAPGPARQ